MNEATATAADAAANNAAALEKLAFFGDFAVSTIYMMGFSFIAGSAVTVLCLLLLDYMRDAKQAKNQ